MRTSIQRDHASNIGNASLLTYNDVQGYLVTITDPYESNFIQKNYGLAATFLISGSDLLINGISPLLSYYYFSFITNFIIIQIRISMTQDQRKAQFLW